MSYHIPKVSGMIRGVAVRLPEFLEFLDKHGIPHRSHKIVRKKVKRNNRAGVRMKQYFLKKGVLVPLTTKRIRRTRATCKGCICIPGDEVGEFMAVFKQGKYYHSMHTYNKS